MKREIKINKREARRLEDISRGRMCCFIKLYMAKLFSTALEAREKTNFPESIKTARIKTAGLIISAVVSIPF